MAFDQKKQVIFSVDGKLVTAGENATDIDAVFNAIPATPDTLIVWFHGGLVDTNAGIDIARSLGGFYGSSYPGAPDAVKNLLPKDPYALFFVWESGVGKSLFDAIIAILERALMKAAMKKLGDLLGFKVAAFAGGLGVAETSEIPDELSEAEQQVLLDALMADPEFVSDLNAMQGMRLGAAPGLELTPARREANDRINKFIEDHAPAEDKQALGAGLKVALAIVRGMAAISIRVVRRIKKHRDHGIQQTVIEETARELGVPEVWTQIKKYTDEAFEVDGVGSKFLKLLAERPNPPKNIYLVGHSTGAVYIANLLESDATANLKFHVRFLAPAIRYDRFARVLDAHGSKVQSFRSYAMQDAVEHAELLLDIPQTAKVALIKNLYMGSLLYMVSGAFESIDESDAESGDYGDCPLVGMQRYELFATALDKAEKDLVAATRNVFPEERWIFGPTADGAPFPCSSRRHGDFDNIGSAGPEPAVWSLLL
jgi:hypothetical protein